VSKKLKIISVEDRPHFNEVGVQVFKHKKGEECYAEGGCSLLFSYDELAQEKISKDDLIANPQNYYVLMWDFKGQTSYYIKMKHAAKRLIRTGASFSQL
jgi:hypothetical protein